ncbi:hypothetical protein QAD02_011022 [Eretmocerus hayati]|uniref:Uncharacterized protein n=1 Tax=Eretmocerus hayati TaxID=131215 RepID=A0ACC2NXA4_9HYME|nr:hypothetical protein QAD02_011022 [Eretmocerus hayati]
MCEAKKPKMSEYVGDVDPELTLTYKWRIDESHLTSKKPSEKIKSPPIPLSNTKSFQICIYPNGHTGEDRGWFSIFLHSFKGNFEAKGRFYIVNYKGQTIGPVFIEKHQYKEGEGYGLSRFKEKQHVENLMIRTYVDGIRKRTLTIGCDLTFEVDIEKGPFFKPEFESRLKEFDDFAKLIDNDEFSDVIITTSDHKLHAHKSILANKSSVFASMFNNNIENDAKKVINVEGFNYNVMREVLRFMYTGRVINLEGIATKLLGAADKYSVVGLKKLCENYLIENISAQNVLECLNFASLYNAPILRSHSMSFFKSNVKKTVLESSFKVSELHKNVVDEVCRIIAVSMKD